MVTIITRSLWGARPPKVPGTPHTPVRICLHHSYSPTAAQFRGAPTIRGIQNFHMDDPTTGWADIGYHFLVSPDGTQIFEGRPATQIGAHAGPPPKGSKAKIVFSNAGTIGICLIGNYDVETPVPNAVFAVQSLIDELRFKFKIKPDQVFGHFESWTIPPKTCPGRHMAEAFGMADRFARAYPPKK